MTLSRRNITHALGRSLLVGIAGDSGSGKNVLSSALRDLFGDHAVSEVSGDNYHLWSRKKAVSKTMTRLNPDANNLERFAEHIAALASGKDIESRYYDHSTGEYTKTINIACRDIIIANGLHALYVRSTRSLYDVKIYLDIDENLRKYFKTKRDVEERKHKPADVLKSLRKRFDDAQKFIKPQAHRADLVLSLRALNMSGIEPAYQPPLYYRLEARSRQIASLPETLSVLNKMRRLKVAPLDNDTRGESACSIEGAAEAEEIAQYAREVCPDTLAFLAPKPGWKSDCVGVMQLLVLAHINLALKKGAAATPRTEGPDIG